MKAREKKHHIQGERKLLFCAVRCFSNHVEFHRLTLHAADPSQILSSKVLRISLGLKLSELSELPVPGSLAAWLSGSLMALCLPGSRAAWAQGGAETHRPREDPADPGSGGQKRTGLEPQSFPPRGGGDVFGGPPPSYKSFGFKT